MPSFAINYVSGQTVKVHAPSESEARAHAEQIVREAAQLLKTRPADLARHQRALVSAGQIASLTRIK